MCVHTCRCALSVIIDYHTHTRFVRAYVFDRALYLESRNNVHGRFRMTYRHDSDTRQFREEQRRVLKTVVSLAQYYCNSLALISCEIN